MSGEREPVKVIGDVIQSELSLAPGQVMLGFQKFDIPTDGLYVSLSYVSSKVIAANSYYLPTDDGMVEVQSVTIHHVVQIDAMSFDSSARTRRQEILMALASFASERAQEDNELQIARVPGEMLNVSSLEESANLQRFTCAVAVTAKTSKQKAVDFYDTFPDPAVTVEA